MHTVTLQRWTADDLPVLQRNNTPEMTVFLGGPETDEQLQLRQERYLRLWESGDARMFTVHLTANPAAVGSAGYWKATHHGEDIYEAGWSIHPAYQGRGIASAALRALLDDAASQSDHRVVYAFPRLDNPASNALCRTVGFTLTGEEDFEYPPGSPIRVNAWAIDPT